MLREGEKIIIQYEYSKLIRNDLIKILRDSSINKVETIKDVFINDALKY